MTQPPNINLDQPDSNSACSTCDTKDESTSDQSQERVNRGSAQLPGKLEVLLIGEGPVAQPISQALEDVFRDLANGGCRVFLRRALGVTNGLTLLRDQSFDVVLIASGDFGTSMDEVPEPGSLQDIIDSIRAGCSQDQSVMVVGTGTRESLAVPCFEYGADAYVDLTTTTTADLVWQMARAANRQRLIAENMRLKQNQQQQAHRQAEEALIRWKDQSALLEIRELVNSGGAVEDTPNLRGYYREVLQTQIIMGSGQPSEELHRLCDLLVEEQMSAAQLMRLHLSVVHETIDELGHRCARHVMNRADGLAINLLMRLADGYHRQSGNLSKIRETPGLLRGKQAAMPAI